jgi:HK97 family phage prohead protease
VSTFNFVAPPGTVSFAVDRESRVIRGLALPYDVPIATRDGMLRFRKGSPQTHSIMSRNKLLRDHAVRDAVGVLVEMSEADAGLMVAYRVARGAAGDDALTLAEDHVLDGLSVTANFLLGTDSTYNEVDGVHDVHRFDWTETSLTAMPAFDDARVTTVAASKATIEGTTMPEDTNPGAPGGGTLTMTEVQFAALLERLAPEAPTEVTPRVVVNEPAPYRFDRKGTLQRGSHDFSADLVAASKGDKGASDRSTEFVRAQFDVDRADALTLNPNRNRPDMYVDQRQYRYPVWEAINKGTLADITPFVFPKFNTSSGLVAAHTEGVEPTPGTFTATSQTVTPAAVSGKVEITREAWDQGGNPQLSGLIWRQMTRAWNEALEARAIAVLDAASPTSLATFTVGGGTNKATLVAEMTAAFAGLQFIRGGFSMDNMFTQIDLYKDLIAAKDTAGRPIYPALGPQNAYGTVRDRFGAIEVAPGVVALPAWALAASGAVPASSYLFDSESVHGWASAPQRLEFNYRVAYVDLAIWGYAATAISDINGVREVIYDPA